METDKNFYDVIIIGGGPAGLSAAIYASRARYRTLIVEKNRIGGQITITSEVVNYPGIEKTSGSELTEGMRRQAENFGTEFLIAEVQSFDLDHDIKKVKTTKGEFSALGIIIATGANPRKIGFKGETDFQGRGVAYCATCDGEFFTGKEVLVVGGGFAAVEESMFLSKYASKITILVRKNSFSCAQSAVDRLKEFPNISVKFNTEIVEVSGEQMLTGALLKNNETGETESYTAAGSENFGVFVFAGYVPNTSWLPECISRNEGGYIITDENQKTSVDGVYAAGDLCVKNLRQLVTAVSDGAVAATSLEKVVQNLHRKYQIKDLTEYSPKTNKTEASGHGSAPVTDSAADDGRLLSDAMRQQLAGVFGKMTDQVTVRLYEDSGRLSGMMRSFMDELKDISPNVKTEFAKEGDQIPLEKPVMELRNSNGASGIYFHAVPGGHELNSFVIGIYNTGGPGQAVDDDIKNTISSIKGKVNIKILVSLSCTMCPETVMSAQRIASLNSEITAEMFDLAHFPALKEKYSVMSVPCVIINDSKVVFGKKDLKQMAELLKNLQ